MKDESLRSLINTRNKTESKVGDSRRKLEQKAFSVTTVSETGVSKGLNQNLTEMHAKLKDQRYLFSFLIRGNRGLEQAD